MRPARSIPEGSVERLEQALRGARSKAKFQRVQCVWLRAALGLNANQYWTTAYQSLRVGDVVMGLSKPTFFGYIIATIGCYYGLSAKGGTQGVGRATTQAVVAASVLILVSDFFMTRLLMGFFSY